MTVDGRDAPILIFLHLPKAAGTTLSRIIEREYGLDAVLNLSDAHVDSALTDLRRDRLHHLRAIVGHFSFGIDALLPVRSTYITLLRDPVDRVMSFYYFVRRQPNHYLYSLASSTSLAEFVTTCGQYEPNNDQTRLLSGEHTAPCPGICTEDMLPIAKMNLRERVAVVGVTEEFDRSLVLMQRTLGWNRPFYTQQNVSTNRPRTEELTPNERDTIVSFNHLDIALYEAARGMLKRQLHLQGDTFEQEVQRFIRANASYGKIRVGVSAAAERLGLRAR